METLTETSLGVFQFAPNHMAGLYSCLPRVHLNTFYTPLLEACWALFDGYDSADAPESTIYSTYNFLYSNLPSSFLDSATFLTALLKSSWLIESL